MTGLYREGFKEKIILVVDDEESAAQLLEDMLEDYYQVISCTSVSEAEEILGKTKVDLIVSDFTMPGQTGLQFAKKVKTHFSSTQFILVTGHGSEDILGRVSTEGVGAVLSKPFDEEELREQINRLLQEK